MEQSTYLQPGTIVNFKLANAMPLFREQYVVPQVGAVVLKGFFSPKAHIEMVGGEQYRMLAPRRDKKYAGQVAYPVVHWPDRAEMCRLLTPVISTKERDSRPPLRFTTIFNDESFVFKRAMRLGRAFEIWDGSEINRVVQREPKQQLILDATVLIPAPPLLVLLLPWLDGQFLV